MNSQARKPTAINPKAAITPSKKPRDTTLAGGRERLGVRPARGRPRALEIVAPW
jgi:hypothetical protein